jgi:excisionase family DNA binding protein
MKVEHECVSIEAVLAAALPANSERRASAIAVLRGELTAPPNGATASKPCLELLTMGDAAKEVNVSRPTLWRTIRDGHLRAVEIRPGSRRIARAELERFVAGRKPAPAKEVVG